MAFRMWLGTILILVVLAAGLSGIARRSFSAGDLRSRHSEPAARVPSGQVVITEHGKTFHKPGCRYLHGKAEIVDAPEAVRKGYSPCVRCGREALGR